MAVQHIFPLGSSWLSWKHGGAGRDLPTSSSLLIFSSNQSLNTSLLFQAASTFAARGQHVTYICREPLTKLPTMVHGMPQPDHSTAKLIKFLYLKTGIELSDYLAALHEQSVLPDILILEDLHWYIDSLMEECPEKGIAKICALVCDAQHFLQMKRPTDVTCVLASADDKQQLYNSVYQRYFLSCYVLCDSGEKKDLIPASLSKDCRVGIRFTCQDQIFLKELLKPSPSGWLASS